MFFSDKIYCKESNLCDGTGVFAKESIIEGEKLLEFIGEIKTGTSNDYTLQVDENKHFGRSGYMDDLVNHSCEPNCYIRFNDTSLIAKRDIKTNEELSFHYCTTEYDLGDFSFPCICGAQNCLKKIRGFRYLSVHEQKKLTPFLFPHLEKKLKNKNICAAGLTARTQNFPK